jgi:hypothetical protein
VIHPGVTGKRSIRRGLFDVVDDQNIDRARLRFQLETELILQSLEKRRSCVGRLRSPIGRRGPFGRGVNSMMRSNFPVSPVLSNMGRSTPVRRLLDSIASIAIGTSRAPKRPFVMRQTRLADGRLLCDLGQLLSDAVNPHL